MEGFIKFLKFALAVIIVIIVVEWFVSGPPRFLSGIGSAAAPGATFTCDTGYQKYPGSNECIQTPKTPTFAGKEKCTPGETRRIYERPDGTGRFQIQTCGYAPSR